MLCTDRQTDRQTNGLHRISYSRRICQFAYNMSPFGTRHCRTRHFQDFLSSVVVLEKSPCPRVPIYKSLSLSPDHKSLSLFSSLNNKVLENCQGLRILQTVCIMYDNVKSLNLGRPTATVGEDAKFGSNSSRTF